MRKYLIPAALALGLAAMSAPSHAQMMGGYGGGYGMGPGMMYGYGGGYGGGPSMMYGYGGGYGPGMMYGYGPGYRGGQTYRGKRLCWHQTGQDQNTGYYGSCPK